MSEKVALKLDWCSYEAAKYAVEHWHYSRSMPAGKSVKCGVWEEDIYIGVVIFSLGSNKAIGMPFGISNIQVCELTRVALTKHTSPVSKIVSIAIRMLKIQSSGLRLIVSYADPREGHIGAIYQASNWIYCGRSPGDDKRNHPYKAPDGKIIHWRTMSGICARVGRPHTEQTAIVLGYEPLSFVAKYKYLYPLDEAMRKQIEPLRKPYPKRQPCGTGEIDNAPQPNEETGGARPTVPLSVIQQESHE